MWLTLHRALVDFDILEAKEIAAGRMAPAPELVARLDSVRSQLSQEAAHAATRISALVRSSPSRRRFAVRMYDANARPSSPSVSPRRSF
jgi:hypothetical protein